MSKSDGSTADYYKLPPGCTELQDLISYRNLNAQDGEMFRAIYRKGRASHSDELRDAILRQNQNCKGIIHSQYSLLPDNLNFIAFIILFFCALVANTL